jgi:hypothetical protein
MRQKLRQFLKSSDEFQEFRWTDKKDLYFELPKNLRYEVSLTMYKGCANFLNFFKFKNPDFVSSIVPFLDNRIVNAQEYIYEEKEYADEIFFLFRGRIDLEDAYNNKVSSILPGGHFGDVEVVMETYRTFSAKSKIKSSLLVMNFDLLNVIKEQFHSVWDDMVYHVYEKRKLLELLAKNLAEARKVDKKEMKKLKQINKYAKSIAKKEFLINSNWETDTVYISEEKNLLGNIEKINNSCTEINKLSQDINLSLDFIIQSLSKNAK